MLAEKLYVLRCIGERRKIKKKFVLRD